MNKATTSPGLRIRELRLSKGLKQGELAQRAGISASYLNLIEYNRRKAKPETVAALAAALGLEADAILGADRSDLVDEQSRQIRDQAAAIAALYERNNFDPRLQATLHEMLTNITAIRSTASILAKGDDLSPAQSQRFQANVYDQSVRLSDATAGLLSFFEAAKDTPKEAATALEAYELFLSGNDHIFDVLEDPQDAAKTIEALLNNDPLLRASESKARARVRLEIYAQDAQQLPLAAFAAKATELAFAPLSKSSRCPVSSRSARFGRFLPRYRPPTNRWKTSWNCTANANSSRAATPCPWAPPPSEHAPPSPRPCWWSRSRRPALSGFCHRKPSRQSSPLAPPANYASAKIAPRVQSRVYSAARRSLVNLTCRNRSQTAQKRQAPLLQNAKRRAQGYRAR